MKNQFKLDEKIMFSLRDLYQDFGYAQYKMSKFESYDLYMQNKEFLVSDGIITFTDIDGTLMALKPDVTLSIIKNFRKDYTDIQKVCYSENVYRSSDSSRQYREILQAGLECMGKLGIYELCEVTMLAVRSLQSISSNYILDLSHMDIWEEIFKELSLSENDIMLLKKYLSEKNEDGVRLLLPRTQADVVCSLLQISGPFEKALSELTQVVQTKAVGELKELYDFLVACGIYSEQVHLDFSIINDQNYYNGITFRGYVQGIPTHILSGGQYDSLMRKMGKNAKAIGFAVYLDKIELLDQRAREYDVDTVVVFDEAMKPAEVAAEVSKLDCRKIFVTSVVPKHIRYRQLFTLEDGRLMEIEHDG